MKKNGLQYIYTIAVFVGVLSTAYFMMSQESDARIQSRSLPTNYRSEASVFDPAVNQLFEMKDALSRIPDTKLENKRVPSFSVIRK